MTVTDTLNLLTTFLLGLLYRLIDLLYNCMIELFNAIILIVSTFITSIVVLFPANPCSSLIASCSDVTVGLTKPASSLWIVAMQTLSWLIPMQFLITLISCAMMSVMIYFSIAPLMRWAKLIT